MARPSHGSRPTAGSAVTGGFIVTVGSVVVGAGGLVLCLLLFGVLISLYQNELGDVSPQEWMLQKTPFVA
jgi:hypothetical protein